MKPTKKILVVDDEQALVDIICEELQAPDEEFEFLKAYNGLDALEAARTQHPDLIVSDITMPGITGLELLETLRAEHNPVPIIICTGFSDTDKIRNAWSFGAFDFLEKPLNYDILKSLVKNALEFGYKKANPLSAGAIRAPGDHEPCTTLSLTLTQRALDRLTHKAKSQGVTVQMLIEDFAGR
jgi:two-component system nitrogen regulation response regulator GlnG